MNIIEDHGQCQNTPLVSEKYFGTPAGPILGSGTAAGTVYIVDESTIFIRGFTFDGNQYPFAFFMGGLTHAPDGTGFIIPDEKGSTRPLGKYKEQDIVIKLPEGRTVRELKWLSVWSRQVHANLGHVFISPDMQIPFPLELPPITGLSHGIHSGPITLVDAQTILVTDFWYDGLAPAAYWWVTRGPRQSPQGLRLKDENNTPKPLRAYRGETFLIRLPESKTIYDFDWFGVWEESFQADFANMAIPKHVRVPPSARMLGTRNENKLNCEVLNDHRGFEIRWIMDNDDIVMQLVSKLYPREYMAFGLSKNDHISTMNSADAAVTWIDEAGNGHAIDYYLSSKEPCIGVRGSCPDLKLPGATDSIKLLHAAVVNGFSMVTFKRPQLGVDEAYDQHIFSDGQQAVIWAIGPLNSRNEVSYHSLHNHGNKFIDFARTPSWNCPRPDESLVNQRRVQRLTAEATEKIGGEQLPSPQPIIDQSKKNELVSSSASIESSSSSTTQHVSVIDNAPSTTTSSPITEFTNQPPPVKAWNIPKLRCPNDRTFWAQIGPVGGARGYQAITGRKGWGIAWYINGLLIPELVLKRGLTYTFLVEGGNDENNGARRHPLYLTDSADGGYEFKSPEERAKERVFGGLGITSNGTILPMAEGRMCEWKTTPITNVNDIANAYPRFEDFQKTLLLDCDTKGQPGVIKFTPDHNTPDTIYYQCFTHRYLGWKIRIVDDCNEDIDERRQLHSAASVITPVKVAPPAQIKTEIPLSNPPSNIMIPKPVLSTNGHQPKPIPNNNNIPMKPIIQQKPLEQRRPLPAPNGNPSNFGPYSHFYGGTGFQRHQLNMLPHTMLQAYHQPMHNQMPFNQQPIRPPMKANFPAPIVSPQPLPNMFNPGFYYQEPSQNNLMLPNGPHMQISQIQQKPHYPMKKFGHRAPPTTNQLNQPIHQKPFNTIRPGPYIKQSTHSYPYGYTPQRRPMLPKTSTQPPMQGGFVPISIDTTNNRPPQPIPQESSGQNVWFPTEKFSQPIKLSNERVQQKPITKPKPKNTIKSKKPDDIYRIDNISQSTVPPVTSSTLPVQDTTKSSTLNPTSSTTTTSTTSTTSTTTTTTTTSTTTVPPPPPTSTTTTEPSTLSPTTMAPTLAPTTIRLVNESSFELVSFSPPEPIYNESSSSNANNDTNLPTGFSPDKWFTNMNVDESGEESQRKLVFNTMNGFEHMINPNFESKPGTVEHVIDNAEKGSTSEVPTKATINTDDNILSDVLRLISFNIPSGRRDHYTPK
ncbi:hypothetical protein BLOT_014252 [Blomia tropicalis]|nr:hypothetical protein BLOT_014252 [Blomia tropicalis]